MAKPNSVEALRQEVTRLRADGKSFGQIGSALGIGWVRTDNVSRESACPNCA